MFLQPASGLGRSDAGATRADAVAEESYIYHPCQGLGLSFRNQSRLSRRLSFCDLGVEWAGQPLGPPGAGAIARRGESTLR